MLHVISARTGRNLSDVVQQALAELLRLSGVDQADLEAIDKGPIVPGPPGLPSLTAARSRFSPNRTP